jgi:excisionase family DNA binding protein
MESKPLLYQIPEACRQIGIGRTLLYELIAAGRLTVVKLGSRTLVPADELARLASELLTEARAKVAG